jgi:HEAT repeat protein
VNPRILALVCTVLVALAVGCEKPTHANLDKWMKSEKGPSKLKKALASTSLDADLSAHAAENLLRRGDEEAVMKALEQMAEPRRTAVVAKLAPRLWSMARVEGEMARPTPTQNRGKDTLYDVRAWADPATRAVIDGYLTDWFTGGYYEGRAMSGRHLGVQVVRALGPPAGAKLIAQVNRLLATPEADGRRAKIGSQLLLGLAVSGSPEAVALILDLAVADRGDPTLPERALDALHRAYVKSEGSYPLQEPAALAPSLPRLVAIAKNDHLSSGPVNDAVQLIRAVGPPACLAPLLGMINHPHPDPRFRWVGVDSALRCDPVAALPAVALSLSPRGRYARDVLGGSTWQALAMATGRKDEIANAARQMLGNRSWVARWIAVETLGQLGAPADADVVAKLSKDSAKLEGYWGDDGLPAKQRKPAMTLGTRAGEIAAALRAGTKPP